MAYRFIDFPETQNESSGLPAEAMTFNGHLLENEVPGYRTLQVQGRELLKAELGTQVVGQQDGEDLQYSRHPARDIEVTYLLHADSNLAYRQAFYKLNLLLKGNNVKFSFRDDPSVYWIGTLTSADVPDGGSNVVKSSFTIHCTDPYAHAVDEKRFPLDSANHQDVVISFKDKVRGDDSGKGIWSAWGPQIDMELPADFWYELPQSDYQAISQDDGNSSLQVRNTPNWQTGVIERYNLFKALDVQLNGLWGKLGITDNASKWDWCVNNIDRWQVRAKVSGHSRDANKVTGRLFSRNGTWVGSKSNTSADPDYLFYGWTDNDKTQLRDYLQDNGDLVFMQYAEAAGYDSSNFEQHKWINTKPDNWRPIAQSPVNNLLVSSATWGGAFVEVSGQIKVKDSTNWAGSNATSFKAYIEDGFVILTGTGSDAAVAYKTGMAGKAMYYDERPIGGQWTAKTTVAGSNPNYFDFPMKAGFEYRAPRQFADGADHGWSPNIDDLDFNLLQTDARQKMSIWAYHGKMYWGTVNSETVWGQDLNNGEQLAYVSNLASAAPKGNIWHSSFMARVTRGSATATVREYDNAKGAEARRGPDHKIGTNWTLISAEENTDNFSNQTNLDFLVTATSDNTHVEITRPAVFAGAAGGTSSTPWNYHLFDRIRNPTKAINTPLTKYSVAEFDTNKSKITQSGGYLTSNAELSKRGIELYGGLNHFIADFDVRHFGTSDSTSGKAVRLYMRDNDTNSYVLVTPQYAFTGDDSHFRFDVTLPKPLSHYTNVSMDLLGTANQPDQGEIGGMLVPYSDDWSDTWVDTYETGVAKTGSASGQYLEWQGSYTGAATDDPYAYSWEQRNVGEFAGNGNALPGDDGTNWVRIDYADLQLGVDVPVTSTISIENNGTEPAPINLHVSLPGDNGYVAAATASEKVLLGNVSQPDKLATQVSRTVHKADFNSTNWYSVNDSKALFRDPNFSMNYASGTMGGGWAAAGNLASRYRLGVNNTGAYADEIHGADAYMPWSESASNWSVRGYVQYQGGGVGSNATGASMLNVQSDSELIASLQLWYWYQTNATIRLRIGNQVFEENTQLPDFNDYIGEMWLKRHGNHFEFSMTNNERGGASRTWSYDINETNTMFEADLDNPKHEAHASNWYWGKWGNSPFVGGWLLDHQVWKDNVTQINDIPNTFKQGDVIEVNSEDHKVIPKLNGAVNFMLGDVGNRSLMAPVGTSYLHVQWSNWAKRPEVYATIRELFS